MEVDGAVVFGPVGKAHCRAVPARPGHRARRQVEQGAVQAVRPGILDTPGGDPAAEVPARDQGRGRVPGEDGRNRLRIGRCEQERRLDLAVEVLVADTPGAGGNQHARSALAPRLPVEGNAARTGVIGHEPRLDRVLVHRDPAGVRINAGPDPVPLVTHQRRARRGRDRLARIARDVDPGTVRTDGKPEPAAGRRVADRDHGLGSPVRQGRPDDRTDGPAVCKPGGHRGERDLGAGAELHRLVARRVRSLDRGRDRAQLDPGTLGVGITVDDPDQVDLVVLLEGAADLEGDAPARRRGEAVGISGQGQHACSPRAKGGINGRGCADRARREGRHPCSSRSAP